MLFKLVLHIFNLKLFHCFLSKTLGKGVKNTGFPKIFAWDVHSLAESVASGARHGHAGL